MQVQSIFSGKRPADYPEAWVYEPESNQGAIYTAARGKRMPSEQGRCLVYYTGFAQAVRECTEPPVTALAGERTLTVLDAAMTCAIEGRSVSTVSRS